MQSTGQAENIENVQNIFRHRRYTRRVTEHSKCGGIGTMHLPGTIEIRECRKIYVKIVNRKLCNQQSTFGIRST